MKIQFRIYRSTNYLGGFRDGRPMQVREDRVILLRLGRFKATHITPGKMYPAPTAEPVKTVAVC
jgi:hypothetical protein